MLLLKALIFPKNSCTSLITTGAGDCHQADSGALPGPSAFACPLSTAPQFSLSATAGVCEGMIIYPKFRATLSLSLTVPVKRSQKARTLHTELLCSSQCFAAYLGH